MANYRGHLIGGLVAGALPIALKLPCYMHAPLTPPNMITWMLCAVAGALFPDIDIHSQGRKLWYRSLLIFAAFIIYTEQWYLTTPLVALAIFPLCLKHRGLTHRLWFLIGAPLATAQSIAYFLPKHKLSALLGALFFIIGALSHWLLDYGPRFLLPSAIRRSLRK